MPTKIEWCDETWNPITGCSHVSEGCRNCYAERMDRRQMWPGRMDGFREWTSQNARYNVRLHSERMGQPLEWKKPRRIFACSISDLFHEEVPFSYIDDVFCVMAEAKQHTFIVLTKRPKRMQLYIKTMVETIDARIRPEPDWTWPLSNVWLGVSGEDQPSYDERARYLLQTPAAKRFVSLEPLLGPIILFGAKKHCVLDHPFPYLCEDPSHPKTGLDWVIVGGESGPGARPMRPDWVRSIRDQCQRAGMPFFFKQWGEWAPAGSRGEYCCKPGVSIHDLQTMRRVGKKRAGRQLDGRTWEEFPG